MLGKQYILNTILERYDLKINDILDPEKNGSGNATKENTTKLSDEKIKSIRAFVEELIIRGDLSDNFVYYRIKQIDKDGTWMYLCNTVKMSNLGQLKECSIFPNPANKIVNVQLPTHLINATIYILNTSGQLVYSQKATAINQIIDKGER